MAKEREISKTGTRGKGIAPTLKLKPPHPPAGKIMKATPCHELWDKGSKIDERGNREQRGRRSGKGLVEVILEQVRLRVSLALEENKTGFKPACV